MTTPALQENLSAYLDDELDAAERSALEQALAQSPELRAELEQLRAAVTLLREQGPREAPVGFHERLMAQIALEPVAQAPAPAQAWWQRLLGSLRALPPEGLALGAVALALVMVVMKASPPATQQLAQPEPTVALAPGGSTSEAPAELQTPAPSTRAPEPQKNLVLPTVVATARDQQAGQELIDELVASGAADPDGLALVDPAPGAPDASMGEANPDQPVKETLNAALSYRLRVNQGAALRQLDELARGQGGSLRNAQGEPLTPETLEPGARTLVHLRVPASRVTAVVLGLKRLGDAQHLGGKMDRLYGDAMVDISVELSRD